MKCWITALSSCFSCSLRNDVLFYVGQNTPESYRIFIALLEEAQTKGNFIPRHAFCFAVALALRQVSYIFLYSSLLQTDVRNIKILPVVCFIFLSFLFQNDVEKAQSLYSQIMSTDSRLCQNLKVSLHHTNKVYTFFSTVFSWFFFLWFRLYYLQCLGQWQTPFPSSLKQLCLKALLSWRSLNFLRRW